MTKKIDNEEEVTKFIQSAYSPVSSFRFVVYVNGLQPFLVRRVVSNPRQEMEVSFMLIEGKENFPRIDELNRNNKGMLMTHDAKGKILHVFTFTYSSCELLPFSFDYVSKEPTVAKLLFYGVEYSLEREEQDVD